MPSGRVRSMFICLLTVIIIFVTVAIFCIYHNRRAASLINNRSTYAVDSALMGFNRGAPKIGYQTGYIADIYSDYASVYILEKSLITLNQSDSNSFSRLTIYGLAIEPSVHGFRLTANVVVNYPKFPWGTGVIDTYASVPATLYASPKNSHPGIVLSPWS